MRKSTNPNGIITKLLQRFFNNECNQPFKYWLYQQSPSWFRVNVVWRYDDLKYNVKSWFHDVFCWYPEYVTGFIRGKDSTGVWIGWSDDDTFIPSKNKKWIKLFKDLESGDEFKCRLNWSILKGELCKIKDVQLTNKRQKSNQQDNDLSWIK